MISVIICLFIWYPSDFSLIFPQFIAEFLAGMLGIFLGFQIERKYEAIQQKKRVRNILTSIKDELQLNLGELSTLEEKLRLKKDCFLQLKSNTWKLFGNQLDSFKDLNFVICLSIIYWDFEHLNESMKKAENLEKLRKFYDNHPPYLELEEFIDSLKKGIIQCLIELDELVLNG
ncbi:hypothetical protein ACFLRN_05455 [Thermoproteota archaeon]